MSWISIKEALPPQGLNVLTCNTATETTTYQVLHYNYTGKSADGTWTDPHQHARGHATHWMLLPEAPPGDADLEAIRGVADSIMSHYLPSGNTKEFSFAATVEGKRYEVFYTKDAEGYWEFARYE
jgi:hypothetical protein